jgi:hypothetical protein
MKVSTPRGACKRLTDKENIKRFIDKKKLINKIQYKERTERWRKIGDLASVERITLNN